MDAKLFHRTPVKVRVDGDFLSEDRIRVLRGPLEGMRVAALHELLHAVCYYSARGVLSARKEEALLSRIDKPLVKALVDSDKWAFSGRLLLPRFD